MTIEINTPELEAVIKQRLKSGAFRDVDELLTKALDALEGQNPSGPSAKRRKQNLAHFLLQSPLRGSGLQVERQKDYPDPVQL